MNPRTRIRSAFRGFRAPIKPTGVKEVPSPIGATTSMTASDQAEALRHPLRKRKQRFGRL